MKKRGATTVFSVLLFVLTILLGLVSFEGVRIITRLDQHEVAIIQFRSVEKKVSAIQKGVNELCRSHGVLVPSE